MGEKYKKYKEQSPVEQVLEWGKNPFVWGKISKRVKKQSPIEQVLEWGKNPFV